MENRSLAQNVPALFLQGFKAPLIIDEIQYAPQLFPYIKDFDAIETILKQKRGHGAVLCMAQTHLPITADVDAVPIPYI